KADIEPIIKVMEQMEPRVEGTAHENRTRNHTHDNADTGFSLGGAGPNRAPGISPLLRKRSRGTSRSDPGVASCHAFETAPKYPATHATRAFGNGGNGSVCQTRVFQPGWKHQGPRRLLDPQAGGRAR